VNVGDKVTFAKGEYYSTSEGGTAGWHHLGEEVQITYF
jgi:hypothetical protein